MNRVVRYGLSLIFLAATSTHSLKAQNYAPQPSLYPDQDSKPRVLVSDSQSWSISGGFGGSSGAFGGGVRGGARPQTAEVIKTFGKKCPGVTVTMNKQAADFVVLFDHEGGKGWARKDNKIAVFNRAGDAIYSASTRSLGNAVEESCKAIMAAPVMAPPPSPPAAPVVPVPPTPAAQTPARPAAPHGSPPPLPAAPAQAAAEGINPCSVFVKSSPNGADIEVDGKFVGNTPSNLKLPPGDHTIKVELSDYKTWERTMTVMAGGSVTIDAKLEQD
jgi:PEGA domain